MALSISMVMLREDTRLAVADLVADLAASWPELPPATEIEDKDDTVSLTLGERQVSCARMPAQIPWSDLEGPCATSILWPDATEEVQAHALHWIVTVTGDMSQLELSTLLTQATAAFMNACEGAIGVYWGNSTLVIPKALFIDFAKEVLPEGPPVPIWIDFRVGQDGDQTSSGFTQGMAALGHLELQAKGSPEPPGELRERLMGIVGYLLENGPAIKDGDTIGEDANERIRAVYGASDFGHEGQVMRLEYERASPGKTWWKLW
jgi:hypothetical protein